MPVLASPEESHFSGSRLLMSLNRYRFVALLIPVFCAFYLFMVWIKSVTGVTHAEIYPFFSWRLFSSTPGWHRTENAIIVHSIDGTPVAANRYLDIESGGRVKSLNMAVKACRRLANCDTVVAGSIYPIVKRQTKGNDVEFSIVKVRIDLRDVRREIGKLADGTIKPSDFYQYDRAIGRWSTGGGRAWLGDAERVEALFQDESTTLLFNADFDLYHNGNTLIYVKNPCGYADTDVRFFLHVFPVDSGNLPDHRKWYSFDNLDFNFSDYSYKFQDGGECITTRQLPGYDVSSIRTGQFIRGGEIWKSGYEFQGPAQREEPAL